MAFTKHFCLHMLNMAVSAIVAKMAHGTSPHLEADPLCCYLGKERVGEGQCHQVDKVRTRQHKEIFCFCQSKSQIYVTNYSKSLS